MRGRTSKLLVVLNRKQRQELLELCRATTTWAGLARRARIVLLLADGEKLVHVASKIGVSEPVVRKWCKRYLKTGLQGLHDLPRSGRPPVFSPKSRPFCSQDRLRTSGQTRSLAVALGL